MKKGVLILLVISFIYMFSIVSAYGGGGAEDYHSICSVGDCIRIDGGGTYVCDPRLGNSDGSSEKSIDNQCCMHKECRNEKCVVVNDVGSEACSKNYEKYINDNPSKANQCESDKDCSVCTKTGVNPCNRVQDCKFSVGVCTPSTTNIGKPHCEYLNLPLGTSCSRGFCNDAGRCVLQTCPIGNITSQCKCSGVTEAIPLYKAVELKNKTHFYTTDINEMNTFTLNRGYTYEGAAGYIFPESNKPNNTVPLYRLWCEGCTDYYYTSNEADKEHYIEDLDYIDGEVIVGYVYNTSVAGTVPLYQLHSSSLTDHILTTNSQIPAGYVRDSKFSYAYSTANNVFSSGYCCQDGFSASPCKCIPNTVITSSCDCNGTLRDSGACCDEGYEADGTCKYLVVSGTYWANMKGEPITQTSLNDRVKLITNGTKLVGKNVRYNITKRETLTGVNSFVPEIITQNLAIGTWSVHMAGTFYFDVYANNANMGTSGELIVDEDNNLAPTAVILSPVGEGKYLVNTPIKFNQASYDKGDDIDVTWDFGDGSDDVTIEKCQTVGNCNTTHTYSGEGTKIVKLTATDERNVENSKSVRIFIYKQGINVFPKITSPLINEIIEGTKSVRFNASESYVANCDISCAIGKTCYNVNNSLFCYDWAKSDIPARYNLWFNWTFDGSSNRYGNWVDNYDSVVEFNQLFVTLGTHEAKLNVGYEVI